MNKEIIRIHKGTCDKGLKKASILKGNETEKELFKILEKCQCIQIINLFNELNNKIK